MQRQTYLTALLAGLLVAFAGRTLYFYQGTYVPPHVPTSERERVAALSKPVQESGDRLEGSPLVLIDAAHDNNVLDDELTALAGRIGSRGGQVEVIDSPDMLLDQLHVAQALIVPVNQEAYQTDEVLAVERFVEKGGRLLLIGDPTRLESVEGINSIAGPFGVTYQDDYLYNLVRNDGGYLNVILEDFEDSPLTEGVGQIVFQTAHSLRASQGGIVFGDENTYSSLREQPGDVTAVALSQERVLALPDLTFLTGPYNTFADNDRFIDNIVGFLLGGQRGFDLLDFPHFFKGAVDVVYPDSLVLNATFQQAVGLQQTLSEAGAAPEMRDERDEDASLIYIALYDGLEPDVEALLRGDGISFGDEPVGENTKALGNLAGGPGGGQINIEGLGSLERGGATFFHLHDGENGTYQLYVLAPDAEILAAGLELLTAGGLDECQVDPNTAICGAEVERPEEAATVEATVEGEREGGSRVLLVSDDAGMFGPVGKTGLDEALGVWPSGYDKTVWEISSDGTPTADDLAEYAAVVWLTGDYSSQAPSQEGADAITEYVRDGGRLLIVGMNIAYDWTDSDFLGDVLGASNQGFGVQLDMEAGPDPHSISDGFDEVVVFLDLASELTPDVIGPQRGSEIVFVRGQDSEAAGEAAMVAREDGSARVAFGSFPLFVVPEDDLARLLENALAWLTE
jgi:hypothetical protein